MNRKLTAALADLHLPHEDECGKSRLRGYNPGRICHRNTVIDQ